jgi:hypothetical protein
VEDQFVPVRKVSDMTPRELDILAYGLKVYIRARPTDASLYATIHDFSKFIDEEPVATIRVPASELTEDWSVDTCPIVAAALKRLS